MAHGTEAHLKRLRALFIQSATWAVQEGKPPVMTGVSFFSPNKILAARAKESVDQLMSQPAAGTWDETPEMVKLRERVKNAKTGEEAEHFQRRYEQEAMNRMAFYSS